MSNGSRLTFLFLISAFGMAACLGEFGGNSDGSMHPGESGGSTGNGNGGGRGGDNGSGGIRAGGGGSGGGNNGVGGGSGGSGGARPGIGGAGAGGNGAGGSNVGGRGGNGAGGAGMGGRGMGGSGMGGAGMGGSGMGGAGMGGAPGNLACMKPGPEYTSGNGSITFYTLSQGSNGVVHCSYPVSGQNPDVIAHNPNGGGQYFGAMNTADYNGAHTCGACVEVTRDGSRKVVVQIVDECPIGSNPKCVRGHIDLSQNAFTQLATTTEGFVGTGNNLQPQRANVGSISWRYVPCPVAGNAFARIKQGNQNEIFIENLVVPVKSVSVNGQTSNTLQTYNAWNFGSTNIPAGANIAVTDINNQTINFTLANASQNVDNDTGKKFPACQ
jgi:expansin (peptidoglycan-binding protein)